MGDEFVAYVSRWRAALLVIGALAFVVGGVFVIQTKGLNDPRALIAGWLGALFFGASALIGARQLFRTGPVMEIDARGILWRR
jgi:hypothetical protein